MNPHQSLDFYLTVGSDDPASAPCARDVFDAIAIRYTVLGVGRLQQLSLRPKVAFVGGVECPSDNAAP
ncbi:hypothetical protein AB0H43_22255 [Hamadaea sp. NPDC050747]|uniref:hypothetical protein n=1 Tax=Hamadaea sp. NPDC050747 TaxID=3155789 RepID=UPI003411BFE0